MVRTPKYKVVIPVGLKPPPSVYEISAAYLLADFFKADVEFIIRSNQKSPDFLINGIEWELKSPTGKGKYNVQHQMKAAAKQSRYLVLDARRSKMHMFKMRNEAERHFRFSKSITRLILIEKNKSIVELYK